MEEAKKDVLKRKIMFTQFKNKVNRLKTFQVLAMYEGFEQQAKAYTSIFKYFYQCWRTEELDETILPIGMDRKEYYRWVLELFPQIGDHDIWVLSDGTNLAVIKSNGKYNAIEELWDLDKPEGRLAQGYAVGFTAFNETIAWVIDVCIDSRRENFYTLSYMPVELPSE